MALVIAVIIIFAFFIGSFVMISLHLGKMAARRALPGREDYLCKSASATCSHCGSPEQREFGLDDQHDHKRVVACAACGKELFQFIRDDCVA